MRNKKLARSEGQPSPGHPPSHINFPPYKHFGFPSYVNWVKARQSEHAQVLSLSEEWHQERSPAYQVRKWSWSPALVESIIDCLREYEILKPGFH